MPTSAYGASLLSNAWHKLPCVAQTDIYFKGDIAFFTYDPVSGTMSEDKTRPITDTRAAKIIADPDGTFSVVVCHHQKFIGPDRLTHAREVLLHEFKNETRFDANTILHCMELNWRNQHFSKQSPA